jgi:3-hydroxyisobutyrate dehydrogenase
MADQPARIGFIGLGAMGLPMALHLVRAGHTVVGFDINADALRELQAGGGETAADAAAAADGATALVLMVATAPQADAVLATALPRLAQGALVILHSTVPPAYTTALGERLAASGHLFLDAPVSGGKAGAGAGKLTIMASGSEAAFTAADPLLNTYAGRVYRLGDRPGVGSSVKMVNQLLAGVHIVSACEAMALGTRAGADPATLFEVISNSAGASWMFKDRVPHILARDFTPASAVEIFVKDLGIVLDTGRDLRFPLPLAAAAHQQFLAAAAAGFGREDDSAVVRVYEQLAGIEVKGEGKE